MREHFQWFYKPNRCKLAFQNLKSSTDPNPAFLEASREDINGVARAHQLDEREARTVLEHHGGFLCVLHD